MLEIVSIFQFIIIIFFLLILTIYLSKRLKVHAWHYRRYVTSKLSCTTETSLIQIEFDFTTTKINQNFSNYSAWHQRSKLLPLLIKEKNLDEQEKKKLIDKGKNNDHIL